MMRERKRDEIPRVVVHEADEVEPLVLAQEKREDVALPELIGLRTLEAAWWVLAWTAWCLRFNETGLVQNASHLRLAHAEGLEAGEHVSYPARAVFGVLLPHLHHRVALVVGVWSCSHRRT
jgi:hypothetical protein